MSKKIVTIIVVMTMAAAGMIQAGGFSCLTGCGQCLENTQISCCGMEHEEQGGADHPPGAESSCCHFELFPENRSYPARTETVVSVDPSFAANGRQNVEFVSVFDLDEVHLPTIPPDRFPAPLYLVKCAFLN